MKFFFVTIHREDRHCHPGMFLAGMTDSILSANGYELPQALACVRELTFRRFLSRKSYI